jgi:hypothetical protein
VGICSFFLFWKTAGAATGYIYFSRREREMKRNRKMHRLMD